MRMRYLILPLAAGAALSGCATYGPYGGSPYGGVSIGYSSGYGNYGSYGGYGGYGGYPGYGAYDVGYGSPYYGWYDDYYYPGTGYYVYDSYRRPHMWNDRQRSYWTGRQQAWTGRQQVWTNRDRNTRSTWVANNTAQRQTRPQATRQQRQLRDNWSGFSRQHPADADRDRQRP